MTSLSPVSPGSETDISPAAVAVAAFQNALARRKGISENDEEYERQKEKEVAIQMDRQKRIREKAPGMKATKPRAGDIDGECAQAIPVAMLRLCESCTGRDQR